MALPGETISELKELYTTDYLIYKSDIILEFRGIRPGKLKELDGPMPRKPDVPKKTIVLTFDACGGQHSAYNSGLIEYLRAEKIPATLFISGLWIDKNPAIFNELAKDTLFEIESHGLLHRVCSVTGTRIYGVASTKGVADIVDEIELNARKIEKITGRRPLYMRPATAYADTACAAIAEKLGIRLAGFEVLSGDAKPFAPADKLARNLVKGVSRGSVVIMHFNHPEWNEEDALKKAIPKLQQAGYIFAKLEEVVAVQ